MAETSLIICGKAGQGIQTIGYIISKLFVRSGFKVFAWQDFQSRIRGGETSFRMIVSDKDVCSLTEKYDIFVSLDETNTQNYIHLLKPDGVGIFQGGNGQNILSPDINEMAKNAGEAIYGNTVITGIISEIVCGNLETINQILTEEFYLKGAEIVQANLKAAKSGYEWAQNSSVKKICPMMPAKSNGNILISGNEAVALGAVAGGCKFISAYPMTPSTGIITYLAKTAEKTGILAEQAEDEISAVNMAIGASYAGARSMTATSGGGFCLMTEGISLAAMTETPLVIVLGQRVGPATGLPTRTEQGDLMFALHAGHGEFPRFIFAPSDAAEAFELMIKAFELSQKYRVTAIVLTDQYLADSYWTMKNIDIAQIKLNNYLEPTDKIGQNFKSYALTSNGISPRIKPGESQELATADSDEHDEYGHITEDLAVRIKMTDKRLKKYDAMKNEMSLPQQEFIDDSSVILVGWGTTALISQAAAKKLRETGIKAASVKFNHIWPLVVPKELIESKAKIFVVENNATGQFAGLLEREGVKVAARINKYDGTPFTSQELLKRITERL